VPDNPVKGVLEELVDGGARFEDGVGEPGVRTKPTIHVRLIEQGASRQELLDIVRSVVHSIGESGAREDPLAHEMCGRRLAVGDEGIQLGADHGRKLQRLVEQGNADRADRRRH
jgi:hypothetical protein